MAKEDMGAVNAPAAPEEGSGVEGDGNLTSAELTGMFARASELVESEDISEEGEGESTEQVTNEEPETDEDSPVEDTSEEPEEEAEDPPDDSEDDDVLSQLSEHAAKKAKKRIDKLTYEKKAAEERAQELEKRIEALEKGSKEQESQQESQELSFTDRIRRAESTEDLKSLRDIAWKTKEWARENWDEHEVELGTDEKGEPRVISHKDLARMLNEAERVLEQDIPRQARYLKQREQVEQNALRDFPAWKDESHPDHELLMGVWNDPVAKQTFHRLPNGKYLAGVFAEGIKAMQAKQGNSKGKQSNQVQDEPEASPAKPKPKVAPRVPGSDGNAAPSGSSDYSDIEKRFQGQTSVSQDDFVAYLAQKEEARRKRKG